MRGTIQAHNPFRHLHDIGRRNRVLSYTLAVLWSMHFGIALTTTFYEAAHLSPLAIFGTVCITIVCNSFFEVFFGWCADGRGAKRVLVAGLSLQILSSLGISQAEGFWQMAGVSILLSMSWSMVSGTTNTIVAATSSQMESDSFNLLSPVFSGTGAIIGVGIGAGIEALLGMQWVFTLQPLTFVVSLVVAMFLVDKGVRQKRTDIKPIFEVSRVLFIERPDIRWRMLLTSTISTASVAMLWLVQPDQVAAHVPRGIINVMYLYRSVLCLLLALLLYFIIRYIGANRVQLILLFVVAGASIIAGVHVNYFFDGLGGLLLVTATACDFACTNSLVANDIKNAVSTNRYTTAQSVYSAAKALVGLTIVPIGVLKEHVPTNPTLLTIGVCTLGSGLVFHWLHSRAVKRMSVSQ
jgi:MFS family permease